MSSFTSINIRIQKRAVDEYKQKVKAVIQKEIDKCVKNEKVCRNAFPDNFIGYERGFYIYTLNRLRSVLKELKL